MPAVTIRITVDVYRLAIGAAPAAATGLILHTHSKKAPTVWWIRQHNRWVHAATEQKELIIITDFDTTLTSGESEQC